MQESKINTGAALNGFPVPEALMIQPSQTVSRKVLLSIIPLTPAPITGPDAWIGWARLVTYGGIAAMTFKKSRGISAGFMVATGLSLVTSLAGEAYTPQTGVK